MLCQFRNDILQKKARPGRNLDGLFYALMLQSVLLSFAQAD
jgi:hypothetical protein